MRLLEWSGPKIDLTMLVVLPFPVEGPIGCSERLHDEINGFPHTVAHPHGIRVHRETFCWYPAYEANVDPSAGDNVDGRHLLGYPYRVRPVGYGVAECEYAGILGFPGENGHAERYHRVPAGTRGVVFVDHYVKT